MHGNATGTDVTETHTACTRGCTQLRFHLVDCEAMVGECRGCLPRPAKHGNLCHPCHRRLELMLTDADTVDRWLTGNIATGSSGASDGTHVTGTKETPLPIREGIYDAREALRDSLAVWVDDIAERFAVKGPLTHTVAEDARFLLRWLTQIVTLDPIGDWWTELADHTSAAHALAPWRPAVRRIPGVPCPRCTETNLKIYGGETDVTCGSCSAMMTEDQFDLWQRVLKTEADAG